MTMQSSKEKRVIVKTQIIALHKAGHGNSEIANLVECSDRTVRKYVQKYRTMGEEGLSDGRCKNGAKRKTSSEEDRALISAIADNPSQAAVHVAATLDLTVSKATVYNRLREAGFRCRRSIRKLEIKSLKRKRLKHREDRPCDNTSRSVCDESPDVNS